MEGGSANDYDYAMGDSVNNFDLDGERCWTGVARVEKVRYKGKDGVWHTKNKEHCNSPARGVKRAARAIPGKVCAAARQYFTGSVSVALIFAGTNAGIVSGFAVGGPPGAFVGGTAGAASGTATGLRFKSWYYDHTTCEMVGG